MKEQDHVTVYYGVQAMGNSKKRRTLELLIDETLYGFLGYDIDVGSSLIENNYLIAAQDGSNDANKLAFSYRQVFAFLLYLEFEAFSIIFILVFVFVLVFLFFFVLLVVAFLLFVLIVIV